LAKILSIAGRTQARAVELASRVAADGGVDLVPLQKYSANNAKTTVGTTVSAGSTVVGATVAAVAAPVVASATTTVVTTVAAPVQSVAAPVQQVAGTVTQPVTQAVSAVGGLLN
jgi:hypothetical protein